MSFIRPNKNANTKKNVPIGNVVQPGKITGAGTSRNGRPSVNNKQRELNNLLERHLTQKRRNTPKWYQDIEAKYGNTNLQKIIDAIKVHEKYGDWRYINIVEKIKKYISNPSNSQNNREFIKNYKNMLVVNNSIDVKIKLILNDLKINKKNKPKIPFETNVLLNKPNDKSLRNINPVLRTYVTNEKLLKNNNLRNKILQTKILKTTKAKKKFQGFININICDKNIKDFLQLIRDDMVHDIQINKGNDTKFKEIILTKFIKFESNENKKYISSLLDNQIDKNKSKPNVNKETRKKIIKELNNKDTFKFEKPKGSPFNRQINLKKYLKKYINGTRKMYQGFDVVYNSNTSTTPIINMMYSIFLKPKKEQESQGSRPIASSSISYATYLDPGYYKRNHKNGSILIQSISENKNTLLKINDKTPTYIINYYKDNEIIGKTTIEAFFQSGNYYIKLNNKTILIQSKNKANSPINKFLGDFIVILTSLRSSHKSRAYATQDKSAALMYIFMSKMMKSKTRLIFSRWEGSQPDEKDILYFKGFNDILSNPKNKGMYPGGRRPFSFRQKNTRKMSGPEKRERAYYSATNSNNNRPNSSKKTI